MNIKNITREKGQQLLDDHCYGVLCSNVTMDEAIAELLQYDDLETIEYVIKHGELLAVQLGADEYTILQSI